MGKLSGIKKALDMSKDSRLKRARDMGFDTDTVWYHHTNDDIKAFDQNKSDGFWFTDQPIIDHSDIGNSGDGAVYPVYLREGEQITNGPNYDVVEFLESEGADSVRNLYEYGDDIALKDPSNIRSVNAAFDPAKKDSANLLAGVAATAVGTGAMLGADDADAGVQIQAMQQAQEVKRRGQQFLQRRRAKQDHFKGLREGIYKALELAEMPQQGLMALTRLGYDMATGNENALQNAARVATQPVDDTAQEFGDYVYDQTGSPAAATAGYVGANILSPL